VISVGLKEAKSLARVAPCKALFEIKMVVYLLRKKITPH
jgi:hypothetical protein